MQQVIHDEFDGYTILTIAHRIGTIERSGKVAVLDQGHVVKFDTAEKVLETGTLLDSARE